MSGGLVRPLSDTGYRVLYELAATDPELFRSGSGDDVLEAAEVRCSEIFGPGTGLFGSPLNLPKYPLGGIEEVCGVSAGPGSDVEHAKFLWEALPTFGRATMSDRRVLAALNCFHLPAGYVDKRWSLSKLGKSKDPEVVAQFVRDHWLADAGSGTRLQESDTAGRLWWLYELAQSAAADPDAVYGVEEFLEVLAEKPAATYHPLLRFPYLCASDKVRSVVLDVLIQRRVPEVGGQTEVRRMLRVLNRKAAGLCLDILPRSKIEEFVYEALPPK